MFIVFLNSYYYVLIFWSVIRFQIPGTLRFSSTGTEIAGLSLNLIRRLHLLLYRKCYGFHSALSEGVPNMSATCPERGPL
jgi:hypothetical protein